MNTERHQTDLFEAPPPVVAIIGRPNVGKSTLFNRILGTRNAIVDDVPGVTRDRNYADGNYRNRLFRLVDTGGLDPTAREGMLSLIKQQSQLAIAEADVVILLVDGRAGLTPPDQEVVELLRHTKKPVLCAVNKIDTPEAEPLLADFYRLGMKEVYPISAEHGMGVAELLDAVYLLLTDAPEGKPSELPRIAIVGRPNVGKSTMINSVMRQDRVLVSEIPGTTRDPIDTLVSYEDRRYVFTDTAGIRRRGRIERGIEGYSVARALKAMGRSDVAVLLFDAAEGITEQDTKIAGLIVKQGRACILVANKWDLQDGNPEARKEFSLELRRRFSFLPWAPILFTSSLKPKSINQLFPLIDQVMAGFMKRVPTGALNTFLQSVIAENPLPVRKGKPTKALKSVFMTQVATKPPVFALFVGHPKNITKGYIRFLENRLRKQYDFSGCPIRIVIRQK
jgi:GTP-binding protein